MEHCLRVSQRFDGVKFHVLLLGIEPQILGHQARSVVTEQTDVNVSNQRELQKELLKGI